MTHNIYRVNILLIMNLACKKCNNKIILDLDENSLEGTLITCDSCNEEFIYHTKTFFLESRLTELDKDLDKKEFQINEQNSLYNNKIKLLELELSNQKKELEKQILLEKKVTGFENRITETEKLNSHQADLETQIFELEKNVKKTTDDILNKNVNIEKKANYLEMKAGSIKKNAYKDESIVVNDNQNDVVNFRAYEKKVEKKPHKKSFFWTNKDQK